MSKQTHCIDLQLVSFSSIDLGLFPGKKSFFPRLNDEKINSRDQPCFMHPGFGYVFGVQIFPAWMISARPGSWIISLAFV